MGWKTITRCVCGTRHQHQHIPCQDHGAEYVRDSLVIGVVADGAGSAPYADIGATLAVNTMQEYLQASEKWLQSHQHTWETVPLSALTDVTYKCFIKGIETVQTALRTEAKRNDWTIEDLACTLLGFLATPHWIAAFQIGDGFIVARSPQHSYKLLFQADRGEYANQTTFVTSDDAIPSMQTCAVIEPQQFICASTDGLEPVAIRRQDKTPFPPFFQPLEDYLVETENPNKNDDYIMAFLHSDRLNQRTDDDKTLLLCRHSTTDP